MKSNWWRVLVLAVVVVGIVLLANGDAGAQCSMCRSALTSATNSRFMRNFNIGVLVLLTPPVAIFCSIFIVLRKYRSHG
jgi:drug/metabolite transporter (DMT)-like permease